MLAARVWGILVVWVALCILLAIVVCPKVNSGFANADAVLTFAGLTAVAIERIVELMWAVIGLSKLGGWWPLKPVLDAIGTVESQTNTLLGTRIPDVEKALASVRQGLVAAGESTATIDAAVERITAENAAFNARVASAKAIAPGSSRLALMAGIAGDASDAVRVAGAAAGDAASAVTKATADAVQATDLAMTLVESFSDNPARRIASMLIGVGLGVVAAGFLGLNIFVAVLGDTNGSWAAVLGVVVTGVVVGLGSSPTHEVIKALQNYKASRGTTVVTEAVAGALGGGTDAGLGAASAEVTTSVPVRRARERAFALVGRSGSPAGGTGHEGAAVPAVPGVPGRAAPGPAVAGHAARRSYTLRSTT